MLRLALEPVALGCCNNNNPPRERNEMSRRRARRAPATAAKQTWRVFSQLVLSMMYAWRSSLIHTYYM